MRTLKGRKVCTGRKDTRLTTCVQFAFQESLGTRLEMRLMYLDTVKVIHEYKNVIKTIPLQENLHWSRC